MASGRWHRPLRRLSLPQGLIGRQMRSFPNLPARTLKLLRCQLLKWLRERTLHIRLSHNTLTTCAGDMLTRRATH